MAPPGSRWSPAPATGIRAGRSTPSGSWSKPRRPENLRSTPDECEASLASTGMALWTRLTVGLPALNRNLLGDNSAGGYARPFPARPSRSLVGGPERGRASTSTASVACTVRPRWPATSATDSSAGCPHLIVVRAAHPPTGHRWVKVQRAAVVPDEGEARLAPTALLLPLLWSLPRSVPLLP